MSVTVWFRRYCWKAAARAAAPRHRLLLLGAAALLKFEDPRVRLIGHLRQDQEVVTTEGLCRLALFTVLVEVGEADGVADAAFGVIGPDGSLDEPMRISGTVFEFAMMFSS